MGYNIQYFNEGHCNLVLKPLEHSCLPDLLYDSQNQKFKYEGNCEVKVLGRNINEVYIFSNSVVYPYVGFEHRIHITCNNFESFLLLEKATFKISLSNANRCKFASDSYLFTLHQHENSLDRKLHQLINPHINVFTKYAETLEEIENLGLQRNSSRDLTELELEITD